MSLSIWSEVGASKQVPRVVHAIDFLPACSATPLLSTWPAGASAVVRSRERSGTDAVLPLRSRVFVGERKSNSLALSRLKGRGPAVT